MSLCWVGGTLALDRVTKCSKSHAHRAQGPGSSQEVDLFLQLHVETR